MKRFKLIVKNKGSEKKNKGEATGKDQKTSSNQHFMKPIGKADQGFRYG